MFFILGSPRSGTTLLTSALNLHSGVVVPHETDFIVPTAFILSRVRDASLGRTLIKQLIPNTERYPYTLGPFLSPDSIAELVDGAPYALPDILNSLYAGVAAAAGKQLAGDKSPNDLLNAYVLAELGAFGAGAKVVHIVRDIRDVIVSLNRVRWVDGIESFFPRFWSDSNLFVYDRLRNDPSAYLLVKYEELVASPRVGMERICRFLGCPFEDGVLASDRRGLWYRRFDYHQNLAKDFTTERVGAWRRELPPESLALCLRQASECLAALGYPM